MVEIYLVAGQGGVGKSSAIRTLTGVSREERSWRVGVNQVALEFYVHPGSIQEVGYKPDEFADLIRDSGRQYVIAAIRISPVYGRDVEHTFYPNANGYIDYFRNDRGWIVHEVMALVNPDEVPPELAQLPDAHVINIDDGDNTRTPANTIASEIRPRWGL